MAKDKTTDKRQTEKGRSPTRKTDVKEMAGKTGKSENEKRYNSAGLQKSSSASRSHSPVRTKSSSKARAFTVANRYLTKDGLVNVEVITSEFGVTKATLAQSLGFAEETLQRFSRAAAPKTQQRLREMLEILTRVERWAGGMPQAMGWYRGQSIPALGDQTAEALVKNDQAGAVRAYLDAFAAGSYA